MPFRMGFGGCKCCSKPPCTLNLSVSDCLTAVQGREVQQITLTGSPTNGTFTLSLGAYTTAPIAYNASAAAIQAALEALPNVGDGNAAVTGGPFPDTPVTVTFTSAVYLQFAPNLIPLLGGDTSKLTGAAGVTFAIAAESLPGNVPDGATYTVASNAQQSITISGATGGTYTLSFGGQSTAPLAWDATAVEVQAALAALSSIGSGNVLVAAPGLTVTFVGALSGAAQSLIVGDGGGLTSANGAQINVSQLVAGGTTIGPTPIPATGTVSVSLACESWTVTVKAPLFVTQSQSIALSPSSGNLSFLLAPEDGYTLIPPSNTPVVPPQTATLTGDPLGAGALQLVSCTGGDCTYLATLPAQTLATAPPCPSIQRLIWYKATYPCGSVTGQLAILWALVPDGNQYHLYMPPDDPRNTCFCVRADQNGNPLYSECDFYVMGYGGTANNNLLIEQFGGCGHEFVLSGVSAGLYCNAAGPVSATNAGAMLADSSDGLSGWYGTYAAEQWILILGTVQCEVFSPSASPIPSVTVSR